MAMPWFPHVHFARIILQKTEVRLTLFRLVEQHLVDLNRNALYALVVNLVLLKCRKLRREDQETSDWIVSRILLLRTQAVGLCSHRNLNLK